MTQKLITSAALVLLVALGAPLRSEDYSKYLWEFPEGEAVRLPEDKRWMLGGTVERVWPFA